MPRKLHKLFAAIFGFYFVVVIFVYLFQEKLIFHPNDQNFDQCPQMSALGAEPMTIERPDQTLRFYVRRDLSAKAWFILFHGTRKAACDRAYYIEGLKDLPLNWAVVEYPGYSADLKYKPSMELLTQNAEEVVKVVSSMNGARLPLIVFGESLGSGIATYVARMKRVAALILRAPYTSISEVGKSTYPYLPVNLIMRHPFPAYKWAKEVTAPVMIVHGTADKIVPFRLGKAQSLNFQNLQSFVEFPGVGHMDYLEKDPEKFWGSLRRFIAQYWKP